MIVPGTVSGITPPPNIAAAIELIISGIVKPATDIAKYITAEGI